MSFAPAAVTLLLLGAPPALHVELSAAKSLVGYSVSFGEDEGYASYTFRAGGKVEFGAQMGVTGKGRWTAKRGTIEASGSHSTWCHDGDDECDPKRRLDWSLEWTDVRLAKSGVITLNDGGKRLVFLCNEKKSCDLPQEDTVLIKLIPAAKKPALVDAVLAAPPTSNAVETVYFRGKPTKNLRKVSELWWVTDDGETFASNVASALAPKLGKLSAKKWTFSKTPYDLIVVIGDTKAP